MDLTYLHNLQHQVDKLLENSHDALLDIAQMLRREYTYSNIDQFMNLLIFHFNLCYLFPCLPLPRFLLWN